MLKKRKKEKKLYKELSVQNNKFDLFQKNGIQARKKSVYLCVNISKKL